MKKEINEIIKDENIEIKKEKGLTRKSFLQKKQIHEDFIISLLEKPEKKWICF